jgi:tetratricopeptide (TPR) repeat protein/MinD-like ATPase involved in chromosome partitioning or flagellar assembly
MIYTFYSYKGGVGRTMALANVAELFYQIGLKVLMIDWDLEAPGLERYFFPSKDLQDILDKPGLMDMILRYKTQMARELEEDVPLEFENPAQYTIDIYPNQSEPGKLFLLTAGRRAKPHFAAYAESVLTFDWQDFYEKWDGEIYFEWLREQFKNIADVILIDSRTGVTEMGGVCTYQMADTVIMFCASNRQNLEGTYEMASNFTSPRVQELRADRPLNLLVIPARIDDDESDFLNEFQREFLRQFAPFAPKQFGIDVNQLWQLKIPYVPRYAYKEIVAVQERTEAIAEKMVGAFNQLTFAISRLAPEDSPIRSALPETKIKIGGDIITGSKIGKDIVIAGDKNIINLYPNFPLNVPLQRPPRPIHFFNRAAELAQILAELRPGNVVTICGPGGIGKTSLAAEVVWQLAPGDNPPEVFPDGIIFYSFYNQPRTDLALEHIVLSFNEEPKPTAAAATQRVLASRQALIILDGAESADDISIVLSVLGNCGALVTSRNSRDAIGQRRLDLTTLPILDAVASLKAWAGVKTEDPAVQRICELLGGLPLAVRLVGTYLAETGNSPAEYLTWLEESPLQALDIGLRRVESISLLLERSLALVSEGTQQILAVVGLLALSPFHIEVIATALDISISQIRRSLVELVNYGLLVRVSHPGSNAAYETSHALIHTYARERLIPSDEVIKRLTRYYTHLAIEQTRRGLADNERLDSERAHLMRVLDASVERNDWEAARELVWAVDDYLDNRGYISQRVTALEIGIMTAQKLENRHDESRFLANLGFAYYQLGEVRGAIEYYEQALAIAREIGDRHLEGTTLGNLGLAYSSLGEVHRAVEYYEQALAIVREMGDRRGESVALGNLGLGFRALGEIHRAIEFYEQSLAIAREIGDRRGEGFVLGNLGLAYNNLGKTERAIQCYEQALIISQQIGDIWNEGNQLSNLGAIYYELGNLQQAVDYSKHALAIYEKVLGPDHPRTRTIHENLVEIEQKL